MGIVNSAFLKSFTYIPLEKINNLMQQLSKLKEMFIKQEYGQEILKTKELSAKILADNCGQEVDKVMKDFNRDHWMDAEESVAYGIVDRIM